jgi:hypothetical protein
VAHEGGSHTIYIHEKYPDLRATVARHGELAKGYARHAIRTIDEVKRRLAAEEPEAQEEEADDDENASGQDE